MPESINFLNILQNLVLLERGTEHSAIIWPLLDDIVKTAVVINDATSSEGFYERSITKFAEALKVVNVDSNAVSSTLTAPPTVQSIDKSGTYKSEF